MATNIPTNIPCPVCQSIAPCFSVRFPNAQHFSCPVCGEFEWSAEDHTNPLNKNQLSAYLAYHAILAKDAEDRYYTTLGKQLCDKYNQAYSNGDINHGRPIHIDADIIANWYPKSFAEKIDQILLYLHKRAPHVGQSVRFSAEQLYSFLFIDRYELSSGEHILRSTDDLQQEGDFMLSCLAEQGYIQKLLRLHCDAMTPITLMPPAYARIDEIQKNTSNGKNVLVAMKFGDDTKPLREAIRKGVHDAEYIAIFIDEVQHNDFITPELLKYIRDSKFVVVDLTHKNNGAYFEEGYAMGLGKPVIQLCKRGVQLHFDIAQKNTIMWTTEGDIPDLLRKRIAATIE